MSAPDLGAQGRDAAFAERRIWVMNVDGSDRHPVTIGEEFRDAAPQWSTDGSHIMFMRLTLDSCAPVATIELLDGRTGNLQEAASGFPVAGVNEPLSRDAPPECPLPSEAGMLDVNGRVQFATAFAWWQDESRSVRAN